VQVAVPVALVLPPTETDRWLELRPDETPTRRLLGYPDPIQGEMQTQVQTASRAARAGVSDATSSTRPPLRQDARAWRLLFQLDSDDRAEMMRGDVGRLYFWIHEDDLRAQRFDRVWLALQCS
jgi:uncharacterized protein YwqG